MVDVQIPELLDGEAVRTSGAFIAFQNTVGSTTFKASVRPNPTRQINVINQAQLEAELGSTLIIPDFTALTISIDGQFTLTKPFLIGEGATLEIFAATADTVLTYDDGFNILFQKNTVNPIRALIINNLQINSANGTEVLMDGLVGTSRLFMDDSRFTDFANLGEVTFPFIRLNSTAPVNVKRGFILFKCTTLVMRSSLIRNSPAQGMTFMSIISDGTPMSFLTDDSLTSQLLAGDSMFYFDPISAPGTLFSIKDTPVAGGGDFFQLGVNANADAIAGAPAGNIRLTVTGHGLNVGQVINITDFVVNAAAYNITTPVTAVIDVNTIEVRGTFGTAEIGGNLNANSLDSTSVLVSASDNTGIPDSMSQAEANSGVTLVVGGAVGIAVPIEDVTPAPGDWIQDPNTEEFSVNETTGEIIYNGIADKTFVIGFRLRAVQNSGSNQLLDIDLRINGVVQTKSIIQIDMTNTNVGAYVGGLFVLSNGDSIRPFKTNNTNSTDTDISNATVLITSA